jgi:DNA-binding SARP family transcriptional activator
LALHAGADVHREAIIDMLWGERPPASAVPKVQSYVSRLRKMLGDGPGHAENDRMVTTTGGCCYRLHFRLGYLDLGIFLQLTREAREAAGRQDPTRACDQYEQALGLWRGDVLADVDLLRRHPATIEVTRGHSEAVLGYAKAAIEAGVHARALPQLRALCAREPLDEQAHAWLMTVLAATGRQGAALQVFADVRQCLDAELGVTPGPVLAGTYARVLKQEPASPL